MRKNGKGAVKTEEEEDEEEWREMRKTEEEEDEEEWRGMMKTEEQEADPEKRERKKKSEEVCGRGRLRNKENFFSLLPFQRMDQTAIDEGCARTQLLTAAQICQDCLCQPEASRAETLTQVACVMDDLWVGSGKTSLVVTPNPL